MNKRRKPNMKGKSNGGSAKSDRGNTACSTNDPMWYASDPAILRDAASIPFSWSLGTAINRGGEGTMVNNVEGAIPGILRMDLKPVMGYSATADSALNTASTAMYSFVRHANSGHSNYDAPDLMMYCGAMSQVYAYINWCQRLYACATMYAQKNRYIPRALLTSMGVDADNIVNNLANFRYWINVMVAKASSLAVPATMSYFSRTAFLYSNIYCESDQIKDQLYYFHPDSWLKFSATGVKYGGSLKATQLKAANSLLTLPEIQNFGEELLGVILSDEDMNIMSGDVLKAYGPEGIIKLASIPEILPIFPVYDPMVLEQFHNATVYAVGDVNITQDPDGGFLLSQPTTSDARGIAIITMNKILSSEKLEPTPEDVIESTRLMLAGDSSRSTETEWAIGCGTEIPTTFSIWRIKGDGSLERTNFQSAQILYVNQMCYLKCFKYAPTVFNVSGTTINYAMESIDNYAVLNPQDIYKLHDTALMNMFAVPSVAKVNRM